MAWTYSLNNVPTDNSSATTNANSFLYQTTTFLTANGWTVDSSSGWTSAAALVHSTAGNTHSWIVLKSPVGFVAGTANGGDYTGTTSQMYLIIDLNTTSVGVATFVITTSQPTGGTTTNRPTVAGTENSTGLVTWHYGGSGGSTTYDNFSFGIITSGNGSGGFYALHDSDSLVGYAKGGFAFLTCENVAYTNPPTNTTLYPYAAFFNYFNSSDGNLFNCSNANGTNGAFAAEGFTSAGATSSGGRWYGQNSDASTGTNSFILGYPVRTISSGNYTVPLAGHGTSSAGGLNGISDTSKIEVYNINTNKIMRVGTLKDILVTGATPTHGTIDTSSTPNRVCNNYGNGTTAGDCIWIPASAVF